MKSEKSSVFIQSSILLCIVTLCILTATAWADWKQWMEEGDKFYSHRNHEGEEMNSLQEAISKYEQALAELQKESSPNQEALYGLYLRLARTNYIFAYYFLEEEDKVLEGYKNAFQYADKAIAINDKEGEAYFWRAVGAGSFRDKERLSTVGGLFGGGIKKDLQKALALDETCIYGGPHRFIAKFYLAKEDVSEAYVHALRAAELAPDYLFNQLVLAETLWKLDKKTEAVKSIEQILSKGPGILPEAAIQNHEVVTRTKQILQEITNHKEPNWD